MHFLCLHEGGWTSSCVTVLAGRAALAAGIKYIAESCQWVCDQPLCIWKLLVIIPFCQPVREDTVGTIWVVLLLLFCVLRLHFKKISVMICNGTKDRSRRVALTLFLYFSVWRTACSWVCLTKLRGSVNTPWQRVSWWIAGFHLHLCGFKKSVLMMWYTAELGSRKMSTSAVLVYVKSST